MDNTNIKQLSESEEYINGLYKSAEVKKSNGLQIPPNLEDEEFKHVLDLTENVILPYIRCIGHITIHRLCVTPTQKLCEEENLYEFPNLTYEDFYDNIILLPKSSVKKILGELNCTTPILEKLLLLICNLDKLATIELMRNNNIDLSLVSKKVTLLRTYEIHNTNSQKLKNEEIKPEEYIQDTEETISLLVGEKGYLTHFGHFSDFLEVYSKIGSCTNDTEKEYLQNKAKELIMYFAVEIPPVLCTHWIRKDLFTILERNVLDKILMREPDYYTQIRESYEEYNNYNNIEPLELPLGLFEEELNDIYNKIERFCPRGQNFTALFGYGELSPIVWTGDWNSLSYFLKVLYGGRLENGFITIKQDVPKHMWDKAFKLFVDENNKHPSLNTLKTRQIAYLQELSFAREINYIFKNVFENIETRKN